MHYVVLFRSPVLFKSLNKHVRKKNLNARLRLWIIVGIWFLAKVAMAHVLPMAFINNVN
jgi:hypothetical protein